MPEETFTEAASQCIAASDGVDDVQPMSVSLYRQGTATPFFLAGIMVRACPPPSVERLKSTAACLSLNVDPLDINQFTYHVRRGENS